MDLVKLFGGNVQIILNTNINHHQMTELIVNETVLIAIKHSFVQPTVYKLSILIYPNNGISRRMVKLHLIKFFLLIQERYGGNAKRILVILGNVL